MFMHDKKLMYTVRVSEPNAALATLMLEQFGGPQGELAAAMRYFTQGLADEDVARRDADGHRDRGAQPRRRPASVDRRLPARRGVPARSGSESRPRMMREKHPPRLTATKAMARGAAAISLMIPNALRRPDEKAANA